MKKLIVFAACILAAAAVARAADSAENWVQHCASCHGKDGKGLTRAGRKAGVKDMTLADYQKTFTDEEAFKKTKEGFKDENGKERMKPFADKLTDDEIKALIAYVRSLPAQATSQP